MAVGRLAWNAVEGYEAREAANLLLMPTPAYAIMLRGLTGSVPATQFELGQAIMRPPAGVLPRLNTQSAYWSVLLMEMPCSLVTVAIDAVSTLSKSCVDVKS